MRGILQFVGFFGAVQALVIAILVGTIAAPRSRWFAALLGTLGVAMAIITLSHTPTGRSMPLLHPAEIFVSLLAPVVFYLWVSLTVQARTSPSRVALLHFLLPAAWLTLATVLLLRGERISDSVAPIEVVALIQMAYTALAAWRVFGQEPDPDARPDELTLARLGIGLFVAIHLAQLVRMLSDAPATRNIVPLTGALVVFALTGLAVRSSRLFQPRFDARSRPKYEASTLTEQHAADGLERLRKALEVDRIYLQPELTLTELADAIGLPRSHLSQLINERLGKSFPEVLAEHRIDEAKRLLTDQGLDHLTVEGLGQRAGFNSRSAFYDAFKKATGKTPAAYRKDSA